MLRVRRKVIEVISKAFYQLDFFMVEPNLRYRQKPYTGSLCLGIFSSLILLGFFILLVTNIKSTLDKSSDKIQFSYSQQFNSQPKIFRNMQFGINVVTRFDPSILPTLKFFTVLFQYWDHSRKQFITEVATTCDSQDWKSLGQNYTRIFKEQNLHKSYCMANPVDILAEKPNQRFFTIKIIWCSQKYMPQCQTQQNITKYFGRVIKVLNAYPVNLRPLSTTINLDNPYPFDFYVQWLRYQPGLNYSAFVQQDYHYVEVSTDESYLSITENPSIQSSYMNGQIRKSSTNVAKVKGSVIFQYNAIFSPIHYHYKRSYTSIDDTISYVGGLIGILIMFLGLFLHRYSQMKYQLNVGENSFNYNSDGKKIKAKYLNAWSYFKYGIYNLFQFIFRRRPPLRKTEQLAKTIKESNQMLDVKNLFKRFEFLQRLVWKQNDPKYLKCLAIQEIHSIETMKVKRNILSYYHKTVKLDNAASVQDALANSTESFQYLKEIQKQIKNQYKLLAPYSNIISRKLDDNQFIYRESEQDIRVSFIHDLELDKEVSRQISHYPVIAEQARRIELQTKLVEVERVIAGYFMRLKPQQKRLLVLKIPILLLNRLRLRVKQMRENFTFDYYLSINSIFNQKYVDDYHQKLSLGKKIRRVIVDLFCALDIFAAKSTLRIDGKPQKATIWFGLFSLIIIGAFIYLFIQQLILMFELDSSIMSASKYSYNQQNLKYPDDIMYAVKFITRDQQNQYLAHNQSIEGIIDVMFFQKPYPDSAYLNKTTVFCTADKWSLIGQNYQQQFQKYGLSQAFCLDNVNVTQVKDFWIYLQIVVGLCTNQSKCYQESRVYKYYNDIIQNYKTFQFQFYFLSKQLDIDSPVPYKYNINMRRLGSVSMKNSYLRIMQTFQKISVSTDKSMWSFAPSIETEQWLAPSSRIQDTLYIQTTAIFVYDAFVQTKATKYQRTIQRIDDLFSYLGGLFGFIVLFFAWWIGSYNQYRYELGIAENCFSYDDRGKKIGEKYLNIFTYIKFSIFDWIQTLCCSTCDSKWKKTIEMRNTREQTLCMLDPQNLFRRLEFLQDTIWQTTDKRLLMCMALIQQDTIDKSRQNRLLLDYFNGVVQLKNAAKVQDAVNNNKQAFEYLKDVRLQLKRQMKKNNKCKNPSKSREQIQSAKQSIPHYQQGMSYQLRQSLILDLGLYASTSQSLAYYPQISQQASRLKLKKQFLDIQLAITKSFMNLSQHVKQQLILKMPIIILHRIRIRVKELKIYRMNHRENMRQQKYFMDYRENIRNINDEYLTSKDSLHFLNIQEEQFKKKYGFGTRSFQQQVFV